jgi:membrane protein
MTKLGDRVVFGSRLRAYGRELSLMRITQSAILLAWRAAFALFPLLFALSAGLALVFRNYPGVQQSISDAASRNIPLLGEQITNDLGAFPRPGLTLALALLTAVTATASMCSAIQLIFNDLWDVPLEARPTGGAKLLRTLGLFGVLAVSTLISAGLATLLGSRHGVLWTILGFAVSLVAAIVLSVVGLRLGTAPQIPTRLLLWAGVAVAVGWQVVQTAGGIYLTHYLSRASLLYGSFGLALGLLILLYLLALVPLACVTPAAVRYRVARSEQDERMRSTASTTYDSPGDGVATTG